MVEGQIRKRGILNPRVLKAMGSVPRHSFVPEPVKNQSYEDRALAVGHGQTISQPYMTALMAASLELTGCERVLEVGAGCGYAAAVLGAIAREVTTVEILPELVRVARANLRRTGRDTNVRIVEGDGGWGMRRMRSTTRSRWQRPLSGRAAHSPDQLNDPGFSVIPVGSREDQELRVITKCRGGVHSRIATLCRFVKLRGGEGWR
jgi:protein-L-isoaspartate(D-aspartate) O-methyltransferase